MRPPAARLRTVLLAFACFLAAAFPAAAQAAPAGSAAARSAQLEDEVLAEIDELRAARKLAPLAVSPALTRAASSHALSMARLGFFSHTSADGTPPLRRILSFFGSSAASWAAGEIQAWVPSPATAEDILDQWLGSALHERILFSRWTHVGVAVVRAPAAPGVYGGRDVTIAVVDFARRT